MVVYVMGYLVGRRDIYFFIVVIFKNYYVRVFEKFINNRDNFDVFVYFFYFWIKWVYIVYYIVDFNFCLVSLV